MPLNNHEFDLPPGLPSAEGNGWKPVSTQRSWLRNKFLWLALGGTGATAITATYVTKPFPPSSWDATMADTGLTFSQRSAELRALRADTLKRRDIFAKKYLETGDTADIENVALETEWMQYLTSTTEPVLSHEQFRDTVYRPYMDNVDADFFVRRADAPAGVGSPADGPADLKLAVQSQIGHWMTYERSHNSAVDPLLNGNLQCRGGTKLFLLAALNHPEALQKGDRWVQIHTKGHTLPGVVTAGGQLIGFEMTKKGRGIVEFGTLEDIRSSGTEIEVTDAVHSLAEDAIGAKPHQDKSGVLDTVKPATRAKGGTMFSSMRRNTDQHGFGSANVPAGPQPMDSMDHIPSEVATSGGIDRTMNVAHEQTKLLGSLDAVEQEKMREYIQHDEYFHDCFNRHAQILREIQDHPEMSQDEAVAVLRKADGVLTELLAHVKKNDLTKLHNDVIAIQDKYDYTVNFDLRDILLQMNGNEEVAMRIWAKNKAKRAGGIKE